MITNNYVANLLRQIREELFENHPVRAMDRLRQLEKYLGECQVCEIWLVKADKSTKG